MKPQATTRLNKHLAHSTGISRREADELIARGRVSVDGVVATLGSQIDAASQQVRIDNKPISTTSTYTYLTLHKPVGYVCSRRRQGDNPTIYELLPPEYRALKPVGRLDRDSSGILLLTDDGDFAHRMTHPSFHKTKTYEVTLDQPLQPLHQQMISDYGVTLEDGVSKLNVQKLEASSAGSSLASDAEGSAFPAERGKTDDQLAPSTSSAAEGERAAGHAKTHDRRYLITMHEGRNRQIRRTFAALGYTVTQLHRTVFGPYHIGDLAAGKFLLIDKP